MDNNNNNNNNINVVAAPPDPKNNTTSTTNTTNKEMEETCQRLARNDPTLTRLTAKCTADSAYFNHGMPGRSWMNHPRTTTENAVQQAQDETELLLNALEHNTHLEELILNFQSLSLVIMSSSAEQKLIHFLKNNPNLKVLRLRIPPEAPSAATQRLLQVMSNDCCSAVQEVHLWVPGVILLPSRSPLSSSSGGSFPSTTASTTPRPPRGAHHFGGCSSYYQYQYQTPQQEHTGLTTISTFLANLRSLQSFHISNSVLAPEDMCSLSKGIRNNHSLKHVHLVNVTSSSSVASGGQQQHSSITNLLQGISQHDTIQHLDLVGCHVSQDDWDMLFLGDGDGDGDDAGKQNMSNSSKLQHLRLQTCVLSLESMKRLMSLLKQQQPPRSSLERLEIIRQTLTTSCAALIADMLQHNTSLRHLVLQRTQVGSYEGALLAEGLLNSSKNNTLRLKSLSLVDNHISVGKEFQDLLQSSTSLQHLDLSNNFNGAGAGRGDDAGPSPSPCSAEESLLYLFQGLEHAKQHSTLKSLNLSNQTNLFQERFMDLFLGQERRTSTTQNNKSVLLLRPQVVECLSKVLANPSCALVALNLSYHRLGDVNFVELCNNGLAHNTSLKRLELRSVGLGLLGDNNNHASMECLGKALKDNTTLEVLDISGNTGLTQEDYQVLANYLTRNKGLVTLLFQEGFHADVGGEEEELAQRRQACARTLLGPILQENYQLTNVGCYSESLLDPISRFYLEWNQHGRRLLFHKDNDGGVPMLALWPSILGRVSQDPSILGAFLRCKADLLASVAPNRHRVVHVGNGGSSGKRKWIELPDATRHHIEKYDAIVVSP